MSEKDNNQCSLSEVCIKSITGPLWGAHYNSKKTIETIQKDFENLNNELKPDNIDSNISSADIFSDETHIYDSMSI
ncbi:hypothetical protein JR053_04225 [Wolbachia endosymbiont of Nasonia vitripennis]|uniref:hypothetical protein n=1 Tax=Wolbachia endosymbiont of Nasonia vitripennis TaxID=180837 RepID=UPI003A88F75B